MGAYCVGTILRWFNTIVTASFLVLPLGCTNHTEAERRTGHTSETTVPELKDNWFSNVFSPHSSQGSLVGRFDRFDRIVDESRMPSLNGGFVSLRNVTDPAEVRKLQLAPYIYELQLLDGTELNGEGVQALSACRVRSLRFQRGSRVELDATPLFEATQTLQNVDFVDPNWPGVDGITSFAGLPQLRQLGFNAENLDEDDLRQIVVSLPKVDGQFAMLSIWAQRELPNEMMRKLLSEKGWELESFRVDRKGNTHTSR